MENKNTSWENMQHDAVYRSHEPRDRKLVECLYGDAEQAVGELWPGCEIFGFNKGQFSLIDVIVAVLNQVGSSTVDIATWTAATKDIVRFDELVEAGLITSTRWVLDWSYPSYRSDCFAVLVDRFGVESVRMTANHCKVVLVRNENWNLAIRSSMNLNRNRRFENFEISDDKNMCDYLEEVVDEIFKQKNVGHKPTNEELNNWFKGVEVRGDNVEKKKTGIDSIDNSPFSLDGLI